jgi:murein DD-endopeptidase MepM/ murein hydrolase activator NlpD
MKSPRQSSTNLLLIILILIIIGLCACQSRQPQQLEATLPVEVIQVITNIPTTSVSPPSDPTATMEKTAIPTDLPVIHTSTPTPLPCGEDWCITNGHFLLQRPISSDFNDVIERSYTFGSTENGEREPHHGVEFTNASGTPVLAAADGTVVVAGTDHSKVFGLTTDFYGNLVVIEHHLSIFSQPIYTLYGHLSAVDVHVGDSVIAGQQVGKVGKSGKAMGAHLHFEVRMGGNSYYDVRNPELWLTSHAGRGVLVGRIFNPDGEIRYNPDIKVEWLGNSKKPVIYRPEPYADPQLKSDDFYQEVFLIGDLPAGKYRISFSPPGVSQVIDVDILPGKVTSVTLHTKY